MAHYSKHRQINLVTAWLGKSYGGCGTNAAEKSETATGRSGDNFVAGVADRVREVAIGYVVVGDHLDRAALVAHFHAADAVETFAGEFVLVGLHSVSGTH
jgi:hypothetical protein